MRSITVDDDDELATPDNNVAALKISLPDVTLHNCDTDARQPGDGTDAEGVVDLGTGSRLPTDLNMDAEFGANGHLPEGVDTRDASSSAPKHDLSSSVGGNAEEINGRRSRDLSLDLNVDTSSGKGPNGLDVSGDLALPSADVSGASFETSLKGDGGGKKDKKKAKKKKRAKKDGKTKNGGRLKMDIDMEPGQSNNFYHTNLTIIIYSKCMMNFKT